MTVQTENNIIAYSGLTGQDTFAYNFRVDQKSDMTVYLDGVIEPEGNWTITGLGDDSGGNVVLNTPLASDQAVVLLREVDYTQLVDYQPFDAFPAETHEGALDKLTFMVQQLQEQLGRINLPPPGLPDAGVFPVGALMIGFNPNGILSGTWEQLAEGTFLMNTVGGSDPSGGSNDAVVVAHDHDIDHGHTVTDPGHAHTQRSEAANAGNQGTFIGHGINNGSTTNRGTTVANVTNLTVDDHVGKSSTDGVPATGANRPLYKGVAIWERTA